MQEHVWPRPDKKYGGKHGIPDGDSFDYVETGSKLYGALSDLLDVVPYSVLCDVLVGDSGECKRIHLEMVPKIARLLEGMTNVRVRKRAANQRFELRRLNRKLAFMGWQLLYWNEIKSQSKNRWMELDETTNSGRATFICKVCGRVTDLPDKGCRTGADPYESFGCSRYPNHEQHSGRKRSKDTAPYPYLIDKSGRVVARYVRWRILDWLKENEEAAGAKDLLLSLQNAMDKVSHGIPPYEAKKVTAASIGKDLRDILSDHADLPAAISSYAKGLLTGPEGVLTFQTRWPRTMLIDAKLRAEDLAGYCDRAFTMLDVKNIDEDKLKTVKGQLWTLHRDLKDHRDNLATLIPAPHHETSEAIGKLRAFEIAVLHDDGDTKDWSTVVRKGHIVEEALARVEREYQHGGDQDLFHILPIGPILDIEDDPRVKEPDPVLHKDGASVINDETFIPVDELGLTTPVIQSLKAESLLYVGDILQLDGPKKLLCVPGVGPKTVETIVEAIGKLGIDFSDDDTPYTNEPWLDWACYLEQGLARKMEVSAILGEEQAVKDLEVQLSVHRTRMKDHIMGTEEKPSD